MTVQTDCLGSLPRECLDNRIAFRSARATKPYLPPDLCRSIPRKLGLRVGPEGPHYWEPHALDALYQLMRNEQLSSIAYKKAADQEFKDICVADGVSNLQATTYYKALRKFGKPAGV